MAQIRMRTPPGAIEDPLYTDFGRAARLLPGGYEAAVRRVPVAGRTIRLFQPADPNALADRVGPRAFEEDERFPYWAELWASGVALAEFLLATNRVKPGVGAVELGCGLGLVGTAAALAGARVVFTDYDPDALGFARANHALNLGRPGEVRTVDWREPPEDLTAPLVLAADVLYEHRFLDPFLQTLKAVLAPGGLAFVAEPGRKIAEGTVERLEREGFRRELHLVEIGWQGASHGVWVHEIGREVKRLGG
ncbi:class I SAM-dependent methyltransferase [Deferrisoma camini]|uniref:class I SAM-dependent methyltransferase n=1 Tax=Deferrisoma camini TaxID=1035120 RepID=UPI00046CF391|nr:methyltransferase [Deferrisoma camini]